MTRVSTTVSSVMVGPSMAIPCAMLCFTSSWLRELSANWARTVAFDRSISSRKKNSASLKQQCCQLHQSSEMFVVLVIMDTQFWRQKRNGTWNFGKNSWCLVSCKSFPLNRRICNISKLTAESFSSWQSLGWSRNSPTFHRTQRFITMFKRTCHWDLSLCQILTLHFLKMHFDNTLLSHAIHMK